MVEQDRETAGTTMCLTVRYVRGHAGEDGVRRMLALAGEDRSAAELEDEQPWSTYEQKIALWEAAAEVLDDPLVSRHIGQSALEHRVGAGLRVLLRTLGSPGRVLSNIAKACPKFSTVATMEALQVGNTGAVVTYELHAHKQPHVLDCECNIGLISVIGPLFGIPPLTVEHPECQVRGAPRCRYEVSWAARSRLPWRNRIGRAHLEEQLSAVTAQLDSLQSTAADLVSSSDVDALLSRIVARAGVAISATRFLLAVRATDDSPLRIHADGYASDEEAERAGHELLALATGGDVTTRIVIDVVSSRRTYGRLAAYYDGHTFFPEERKLLASYARSAAAALDAATALDAARQRGATASALLGLARALADVSSAGQVAQKLAEAMPPVVGSHAGVVLLFDPQEGTLAVRGRYGWSTAVHERLGTLALRASDSEGVERLVTSPTPVFARVEDIADDFVRNAVSMLEVEAVASVPIVQHGELLGLAVAGFREADIPAVLAPVLERTAGVADHAATALQNARLLERISHQALHDPLTSLPNRALFEERVSSALARAGRDGTRPALLFVDLDRFKRINDSLGHEHGDRLLQRIATRLMDAIRAGDEFARVGGDEFAVLLHDVDHASALRLAERIRGLLGEPVDLDGETVVVSASIGVSMFPEDGRTYDELLRRADFAMYDAKAHGRDACRPYLRGTAPGRARLALEAELRRALLEDELSLVFQPEVALRTDEVVALEALIRWNHPVLGRLSPERFLRASEEAGLSLALDVWALRSACRHAQTWREQGATARVAVNVAASNCARRELVDAVAVALSESGLAPEVLELEITETAALDATPEVAEVLGAIREMGVSFALDDFGVGYSLFGRLRDFAVSRVKIDASFVQGPGSHDAIVGAITTMGHGLGLEVAAEGIETAAQLELVARHGCDLAQGFLLARPVEPADVPELLDARLVDAARRRAVEQPA